MCGIIGVYVKRSKHIKKDILSIYQKQSHRGKSGFGILIKKPSGLIFRKRFTKERDMMKDSIWGKISKNDIILFHHRIPTSTPNLKQCNHPLSNEKRNIYLIHNGHINEEDLDLFHYHKFESKIKSRYGKYVEYEVTDSEIAIHYIEEAIKRGATKEEAIKELIEKVYYSSFIIVFRDEHKLYFGSNNQVLKQFVFKKNIYIASETNYLSEDVENTVGYIRQEEIKITPIIVQKRNYWSSWYGEEESTPGKDDFHDFYEEEKPDIILYSEAFKRYKEEALECCGLCKECDMQRNCIYDFQTQGEEDFY